MSHLHLFNTQSEFEANKDKIVAPWVAFVREDNSIGLSENKDANEMFNFQTKTVDITENGKIVVTPDNGYGSMSNVIVNVNVGENGNSGSENERPEVTKPTYTGHADAEGLRAIGWTEEDIQYYQEHGVNWNEGDDQYHLVSDDNKALYGVLTASNISSYKGRIVYLPKIDTSKVSDMSYMFEYCSSLVSIPQLDTSNVTNMSGMFNGCRSLVLIPQLDTNSVTNMSYMFSNCYSLTHLKLKNAKLAYQLNYSELLSKESLLYLINNESSTSAITIKLATYAYTRLAEDADIVAALAAHSNISIAQ